MKNIHANLVGSIKKDIYVIKNKINSKVYVGQSKDPINRFKKHCRDHNDNSLISKAIRKYGKEYFYIEILEKNIENYNEKEIYWIEKLNSIKPFGYNILAGGEDPPIFFGDEHPNVRISDKDVLLLKKDLKETQISLMELAKKYDISKKQVLRINQGLSREVLGEKYPVREEPNSSLKLTEEQALEVIDMLKYTYRFNGEIAKQFNVGLTVISNINKGITYHQEKEDYPIRKWKSCGIIKFTYEEVTEIINLLKTTSLSIREIGRRYQASHAQISAICSGKAITYKRKEETYPLR